MLMKAKSRRPTLFVWARLLRLLMPGDQAQITLNGRELALLLLLFALRHKLCRSYKLRGEVIDIVQFAKGGALPFFLHPEFQGIFGCD
jgi:hypothetical protein